MTTYGLYDRDPQIKNLQRALNELLQRDLKPDGDFGKITQAALQQYQTRQGLTERNAAGACYGPLTQAKLAPYIHERFLTEADFAQAAQTLGCSLAQIKAVTQVEAKEFGFLCTGHPVILFERHKYFHYYSQLKSLAAAQLLMQQRPDLCNTVEGGYLGGLKEVTRYEQAAQIHEAAAMLSCSWGLFQVMGFQHQLCGFATVQSFVEFMEASERNQLQVFVKFLQHRLNATMLKALQTSDWPTFARLYNGPKYKINNYDTRLAAAQLSYAKKA